jgi:polysaccharide pyruvyl transferase WcaK-like protein
VIVYGASVGPWGDYGKAVDYNIKALGKYKLILCREYNTIDYLKNLGLNNVKFFPDPAFQIKDSNDKANHELKYIGINFSPLSFKEVYGNYSGDNIRKIAVLLDKVVDTYGNDLMFIPHVLSESENDNDLWFMEKILQSMDNKDHVVIADSSKGFIGVKKYIKECLLVVSARMHCAINAIDENIPTIFIAYSQKAVGMCEYVYGNDEMVIDINNIHTELIPLINRVLNNREAIADRIKVRNSEISSYYRQNINEVKLLLNDG